ncbi:MAG: hypothetical protein ABL973_11480 [Micropepsaceae bacterium]
MADRFRSFKPCNGVTTQETVSASNPPHIDFFAGFLLPERIRAAAVSGVRTIHGVVDIPALRHWQRWRLE